VTGDFHSFSLSALTAAPRVHPRLNLILFNFHHIMVRASGMGVYLLPLSTTLLLQGRFLVGSGFPGSDVRKSKGKDNTQNWQQADNVHSQGQTYIVSNSSE